MFADIHKSRRPDLKSAYTCAFVPCVSNTWYMLFVHCRLYQMAVKFKTIVLGTTIDNRIGEGIGNVRMGIMHGQFPFCYIHVAQFATAQHSNSTEWGPALFV